MQGYASRVLAQRGGCWRSAGYEGKGNIYEQTVECRLCQCSTTRNVNRCSFEMEGRGGDDGQKGMVETQQREPEALRKL